MTPEAFAHVGDAMGRADKWLASGSPAHPYETGPGGWCARCGCGSLGEQHHQGATAEELAASLRAAEDGPEQP
jgi:hypothetical protein